jgi:AcrR family transcriptional regulator
MALHKISEAAALVGVTRQTLYRHIKSKGISVETDAEGATIIETSELIRVYGPLSPRDSSETVKSDGERQGQLQGDDTEKRLLQQEIAHLRDKLDDRETTIADLKATLDYERRLLPVARAAVEAMPPATATETTTPSPGHVEAPSPAAPRRTWWQRLKGQSDDPPPMGRARRKP